MKPKIQRISQISAEQSVICIIGEDQIPERLNLTRQEKDFAQTRILAKEEYVFLNSYNRSVYLVGLKHGNVHYKVREELRRTAYNLRNLIKENNYSDLVITSENAYKGAIEDFTEGLLLSFYSFDKYKTKAGSEEKKHYPERLLLQGDMDDS